MPKLLFVTTKPFYPDTSGGAQQSSLYLFESLRQLGWQVEVICGLSLRSPSFLRTCWRSLMRFQVPSFPVIKDEDFGYTYWRRLHKFSKEHQWIQWFDRFLREYQPDVVLGHSSPECPLLNYAARQGYPSFFFVRYLRHFEIGCVIPDNIHPIANSPFAASVTARLTGKEVGVVLPFVDANRYRVEKRERRYITFINPVSDKGVEVAIEVARSLPQERFLFVKGKWTGFSKSKLESYLEPIHNLPNVEVWDHQQDMTKVYAVTDILLVPSQFEETFGRVIVEAQVNGIPVVAAKVGGIPYTLGQGGILVEPKNDPQGYTEALQRLRTNENYYAQLSALAIQNSQRPEYEPQYQVKNFIRLVESRNLVKADSQAVN